jgi:putative oxidoreductase
MNRPDPPATFVSIENVAAPRAGRASALHRLQPYVLSILRIMAGLLFLEHGMAKLFGFPSHGPMPSFPELEWFAGMIELTGGTLVALGLFTRVAAFIMSGEMAIGYFMDHAPRSFFPLLNGGEAAVLYSFVFLYFVFAGAGPLSLDALVWGRKRIGG